ncbi:MAG: hypothetical protein AB7K52_00795 [Phycisphaerales bacterium]
MSTITRSTVARVLPRVTLTLTLALAVGQASAAVTYHVQLDTTRFGHLNQANVPLPPGGGGQNSCVPTAVVNSFVWLQNVNPTLLGNDLLAGGTLAQNASNLGENFMGSTSTNGTSANGWIDGKVDWVMTRAAGRVNVVGQSRLYNGGFNGMADVAPTWQFLFSNLTLGAGIELGILPNAGGIGHAITLTSFHWTDQNMDGVIQMGENATLDFIDPAAPANVSIVSVFQDAMGRLQTNYGGGQGYNVALAVAQVAVPTPSGVGLASIAVLIAARRRRVPSQA